MDQMAKKQAIVAATWGIRNSFQSIIVLLVSAVIVGAVYLTQNGAQFLEDLSATMGSKDSIYKCNLFYGKWVFDNHSYPLYKEKECTFMSDQLACEKFGRKDFGYQNWRWQPNQCDLPRSVYMLASFDYFSFFMIFLCLIFFLTYIFFFHFGFLGWW